MKTKMQIKSTFGKLLFEHESENNTVLKTLKFALKNNISLDEASLYGAILDGASLDGASLNGASLDGAKILDSDTAEIIVIKKVKLINGIYKYEIMPFFNNHNEKYIKFGCFCRSLEKWKNDFWNNNKEFPNNGSEKSELRKLGYEISLKWFELIEKSINNIN